MAQLVVNDNLVHYTDSGKGPVLLCVHGWMHDAGTYKNLTEELIKDFRIVALDLPNFGQSSVAQDIISTENYAEFLAAFIKKLGIDSYVYIGHSMGGQIGIFGTAHKLLQPEKLILISSAGIRDHRKITKTFLKAVSKVLGPVVPKAIKKSFYKAIGSDYQPDLSSVHKQVIRQTLSTDIQRDAQQITQDTLLIWGQLDSSTPLWMGEKLQKLIKNSRLEMIEGENHWLHQTSAAQTAKFIKRFLA